MLKDKKLFLFDIDGTLALDYTLIEGTRQLLAYIQEIGGKAIFITNNSTKSLKAYVEKFRNWGFSYDESHFITASYATCVYLREHYADERIFVLGTRSLIQELRENGFDVTEDPEAGATVALIGYDNELTYQKVWNICQLIFEHPETVLLATNPDLNCPTVFGSVPDCGSICQMVSCAIDREPYYIGKPNPVMVNISLEQTGFSKEQTLVVGDRFYTDIACGINGGVDTAVVFTGEAREKDLADTAYPPTYAFPTVKELYQQILTEKGMEEKNVKF